MKRIRRQRTKGWRLPPGAIYVGRPGHWGNPYQAGASDPVVTLFRAYATARALFDPAWLAPLRGHDLVCWCPLDRECHADVLLELLGGQPWTP